MNMFASGLLLLCVAAILAGIRGDDDECKPNTSILNIGSKCCRYPHSLKLASVMKECNARFDLPTCAEFDCVFEKMDLITDGKIDLNAMAESNIFNPSEEVLKDAMVGSKLQCIKDLSDHAEDIACESLKIFVCCQHIMTAACPDELWTSSAECEELMSYVYKCPPI